MANLRDLFVMIADAEIDWFRDGETIDKLVKVLNEVGVTSPFDLRLWFDGDEEDLVAEIREITRQVNHDKAEGAENGYLARPRMSIGSSGRRDVACTCQAALEKSILVMGRMVIDREAELASSSKCCGLKHPLCKHRRCMGERPLPPTWTWPLQLFFFLKEI